jgi:hypothetical protein
MKYLIIGEPRSGKTEFGNELAQAIGCEAMDTSTPLIERLAALKFACMVNTFSRESWVDQIRVMKDFYRPTLVALGNMLCDLSPSVLLDECAAKADVIMGARRMKEVEAFLQRVAEPVEIVKIVRPGTRAPDNYELGRIEFSYPVTLIENDGTIGQLSAKAQAFADASTARARARIA